MLKDPDSLRVGFMAPKGAAVCGTVNARNSFGGYTGAQVFLATFMPHGTLEQVRIFSDKEVRERYFGAGLEGGLLRACRVYGP
jgi:hypothetical protein